MVVIKLMNLRATRVITTDMIDHNLSHTDAPGKIPIII